MLNWGRQLGKLNYSTLKQHTCLFVYYNEYNMHDRSLTTIRCIFSIYESHDFLIKSTSLHGIKYFELHKACHIALTQGCQSCTFLNGQVCCYNCIKNFSCHYLLSENIKKQLAKRYKHCIYAISRHNNI